MSIGQITFYAPLKAPNHPIPSGDRRMARLLIQALEKAGAVVEIASDFRSYEGLGNQNLQHKLREQGNLIASKLISKYSSMKLKHRPKLWFTYHLYHKAPDWIGPKVSEALGIPYVVAEASFAPKQATGPWALGHSATAQAIKSAKYVFCLTHLDMACVGPLISTSGNLKFLPPFLDPLQFSEATVDRYKIASRFSLDPKRHWLLTVAMMRPGDKLKSYQRLSNALSLLEGDDWQLLVVGDGLVRDQVSATLAHLNEGPRSKLTMVGALPYTQLPKLYASSDIYLWPGVGEAYGMAYLEAQAAGLPVIAGNERGVPDVVIHGKTGLLTEPGDDNAYASAIRNLLDKVGLRECLAKGAENFIHKERNIQSAAKIIGDALKEIVS